MAALIGYFIMAMPRSSSILLLLLATVLVPGTNALPKILCLHGGGSNGVGFQATLASQGYISALSDRYEFVFANAGNDLGSGSRVWLLDPPGGKSEPTNDPTWAAASFDALDELVAAHGPFYAILGYSQGSARGARGARRSTVPGKAVAVLSPCKPVHHVHAVASGLGLATSPTRLWLSPSR